MKIIVGLGNPGFKYRNTKHNAGFKVLDVLAKRHRLSIKKKGFNGIYGFGRIKGKEVILFKPLTYMNLSGKAVGALCASHLSDKRDLLIISDDLDLPLGDMRLREKGSSGGHNGLQSIIEEIGSEFARLKLGIRIEGPIEDAASYVLSSFPRAARRDLNNFFDEAAECAETWLEKGTKSAMNYYNK